MSITNTLFYTGRLRNADDFEEFASRMKQEFKLQELIRKEEILQRALWEQTKNKVFEELVVDEFAWKKHPLLREKDKEILPHPDSWKSEAVSRIRPKSEVVCQSIQPLLSKFTPPKPTGIDLRSLLHIGAPTEKFDIAELNLKEAERVHLFEVPDFQSSRVEFWIEPIIKRAKKLPLHLSAKSPTGIPERIGFESACTNAGKVRPDEWEATALESKKSSSNEKITCAPENLGPITNPTHRENIDLKSTYSDENEIQPFDINSNNLTEANIHIVHDEIAFKDNDDFVEVDNNVDITSNAAPEKKHRKKRIVDGIRNFWNGLFVCGKRVIQKD